MIGATAGRCAAAALFGLVLGLAWPAAGAVEPPVAAPACAAWAPSASAASASVMIGAVCLGELICSAPVSGAPQLAGTRHGRQRRGVGAAAGACDRERGAPA